MKLHILRRLLKQPGFTAITIITLAIGIGANSSIFAVIEGVLLRPLPFPHSEQLVDVDYSAPGVNLHHAGSAPFLYFTYRDDARTLRSVGLWRSDTDNLTGLAEPEEVPTLYVTEDIFVALDVQPLLGRLFSKADTTPGTAETVMISYGFWKTKFGGDAHVVGRRITLDGRPSEIIGVLPQSFRFLDRKPEIIVPLRLDPSRTFLGNFSYSSIARLKPGVTLPEANADAARLVPISMHRFPPFPGYTEKMFEDARLAPDFVPLKESLLGDISTVLWVLMGTVGVVLLIACANVANLMLVRAQDRQHELAIRAALGASWWQVARELLWESVALGILGGVAGLGIAYMALRLLIALAPANLPRLDEISLDARTVLFTLAISILAGAFFGLITAIKYATPRIGMSLRAGGRGMSQSRERDRARNMLVVVQVALALVLLISSGLMIRTFQALRHIDPGFTRPDQVQVFGVYIPPTTVKDPVAVVHMEQTILDKLGAVPGVSSVAMSSSIPMTGNNWNDPIFAEDKVYAETQIPPLRRFKIVSPGFFTTMGNSLIAGRDFTWSDSYEQRHIMIVSLNFAREFWGDAQSALGKRIRENTKAPWREIVGVVSDERDDGVDQKAPTIVYALPLMDYFDGDSPFVQRGIAYIVRSSRAGTKSFVGDLSQAVWSVNPNLPLASVRTLREIYDKSLARTSFALVMLAVAGATALLLGVAGVYGVISYSVSQRTREVGIRVALGAQNGQVVGMFLRQAATLAAIGIASGIVVAFGVVRLMSSLLWGVKPTDPLTYVIVVLALAGAVLLASYVPALRATGVDPVEALRAE